MNSTPSTTTAPKAGAVLYGVEWEQVAEGLTMPAFTSRHDTNTAAGVLAFESDLRAAVTAHFQQHHETDPPRTVAVSTAMGYGDGGAVYVCQSHRFPYDLAIGRIVAVPVVADPAIAPEQAARALAELEDRIPFAVVDDEPEPAGYPDVDLVDTRWLREDGASLVRKLDHAGAVLRELAHFITHTDRNGRDRGLLGVPVAGVTFDTTTPDPIAVIDVSTGSCAEVHALAVRDLPLTDPTYLRLGERHTWTGRWRDAWVRVQCYGPPTDYALAATPLPAFETAEV